ncbi:MAG: dimethylarginine dimethylaminohydrolase family protein [Nitrospinaceae bacterium]
MDGSLLMCSPDYFGVNYTINPWMEGQIGKVDPVRAKQQWKCFYEPISRIADVKLIPPHKDTPDLVFTANAGLIRDSRFVPSRFRHKERQPEEPYFIQWFRDNGFDILPLPEGVAFEGAGDALFQPGENFLWAGYGFRSDKEAHPFLEKAFDCKVVSLRLNDKRFYHLDTCFCPLQEGTTLYFPEGFDAASRRLIEEHSRNPIPVAEEDALKFACNTVLVNNTLFMNHASPDLRKRLEKEGYRVRIHNVDEFLKAGGANKCLTIALQ